MSEQMLTVQEAAQLKNVSIQAIRDAIKRNKFPGAVFEGDNKFRGVWKLPKADVESWKPRRKK